MSDDPACVLVVEDDPEVRELLVRLLHDAGYLVDAAPDGQAGLHQGLTRRYHAMIIDRGLPGIEGLDLIGRLRRRRLLLLLLHCPRRMLRCRSATRRRRWRLGQQRR